MKDNGFSLNSLRCWGLVLVVTSFAVVGVGVGCSDGQNRVEVRADQSIEDAGDEGGSVRGEPTTEDREMVCLRRWIDKVLLADESTAADMLLEEVIDLDLVDEAFGWSATSPGVLSSMYCSGYSPEEIAFVVSVGPRAIPLLIKHVRDMRETPWVFYYPLSSGVTDDVALVGELACYMVEALLRKNIYFTRTALLANLNALREPSLSQKEVALLTAATAYERWYERCFDEATSTIVCSPEDLPKLDWNYDLSTGEKYIELRAKGICGSGLADPSWDESRMD